MIRDADDYKLAFSMIRGVNITTAAQLLAKVGSEENFFTATDNSLKALTLLHNNVTERSYRDSVLDKAVTERAFTDSANIERCYFNDEDNYPQRLAECNDAPAMLYKLGRANLDSKHTIAIVGTRHATAYGIDFTTRLVESLSESLDDLLIVSGLAYGIDVAAHKAALKFGIPTVGVMAQPLNTIYPADHRAIAAKMINEGGALVTEYCTSDAVHKGNFLARNRIIAGLCDATIVVESDLRGGAMATARIANAYNRDVFAVPGRVIDKYSHGCNQLIANQTANLLTCADDIIEVMGWHTKPKVGEQQQLALEIPQDQAEVLELIKAHPDYTVNDMVVKLGKNYAQLSDLLFQLEMADMVISLPGGRYTCVNS
jgi:DNA processing protein